MESKIKDVQENLLTLAKNPNLNLYNNTYKQIEEIEEELDAYMVKVSKPLEIKNYNTDLNKLENTIESFDSLSLEDAFKKYNEICTLFQSECIIKEESIKLNFL